MKILGLTGPELAEYLNPTPSKDLRRILEEDFPDRPVGKGISGRDAYPALFAELDRLRDGPERSLPEPMMAVPF